MPAERRLLICTRSTAPEGGADRIVADLARDLSEYGWSVQVAAAHGAQHNRVERYRAAHPDISIHALDAQMGTRTSRIRALREAVRQFQPDIVLTMRLHDVFEAVAGLKSDSGPRLAVGLRAFEAEYFNDLKAWAQQVDLCVTSGELIADVCRQLEVIEPQRIVSIGGGVHPPLQKPHLRSPQKALRILYCGRFDPEQKRALDVLTYVDELQKLNVAFELELAGSGPAEQALRQGLQPHIDAGRVRMLGWRTRENLYQEVYPRADVFIHFAAWEGMTIAPREAMAHGAVPVISRFPGLHLEKQFVDGATALTFPVGDVRAAALATERLAKEPGLLQRLSQGAAATQCGAYLYAGAIRAWAEALDRCIQMPVARGRMPAQIEQLSGRLARLGISAAAQDSIRRVLRRPVRHGSPGSEWPSASRRATATEILQYRRLADLAESRLADAVHDPNAERRND